MAFAALRDYIIDNFGRPLEGVAVTVKYNTVGDGSGASPGDIAPIKTDRAGGTPLANPFTNESDGSWVFWADIRNTYDVEFSKVGVTFDNTDFTDHDVGFLPDNAVTTTKINALAVTAAKIAANTITAAQIAASTITTTEIAANTILSGDISAGAITDAEVAGSGITTRSKLPSPIAYEDEGNFFGVANVYAGRNVHQVVGNGGLIVLKRSGAPSAWYGIEWKNSSNASEAIAYFDSATNEYRVQDPTTDRMTLALGTGDLSITGALGATAATLTAAGAAGRVLSTLYKDNIMGGWCFVKDVTGTPTLQDDFNVDATITDNAVGDHTVLWTTDFADVNYAIAGTAETNLHISIPTSVRLAASTRVYIKDSSDVFTDADWSVMAMGGS